ncbi:MAG: DMT family transporter [Alphaproteobacteria bacterium]|nr:DMT family transporter [Alphaproteobacteria bacterium]
MASTELPGPSVALTEMQGRALALLAGAIWSTGGILLRWMEEATSWQILLWRSVAVLASMLIVLAVRDRQRVLATFRAAGMRAVLGGLFLSIAFTGFILALIHTTVASALFLLSTMPFLAAVLGWLVLGERVRRATWFAMAFGLIGVGVMVGDGLALGQGFGNAMGLVAAMAFACYAVTLRSGQNRDMMPAVAWAGLFGTFWGVLAITLSGDGAWVSARDLGLCLLAGAGQITLGMVIYVIGTRVVTAGEAALLTMSEVVLGPIWVWLGVGEVPSQSTILGGAILLGALVGNILSGMRRRRPPIGVA